MATRKPPSKPTKPAPAPEDPVSKRISEALISMIAAAESGFVAAATAAQATGGAESVVGGQAAEGGVSAQQGSSQQHTGASHKNDTSVPEAMEGYNLSGVNDNAHIGRVNARSFDAYSATLNTAFMGHVNSINQQSANTTIHADEEYSARKRATELSLGYLGDAVEETADDTARA